MDGRLTRDLTARRRTAVLLAAAASVTATRFALADPPGSNYRLVFADEFNGTSLDTSKWVAASPGWTMPNSDSTATASDVSVGNGVLTLSATRTSAGATFNSGSISSYGLYNLTSGYIEARIDLPSTPGSWPAFWGLYNGWPPEADIMEYPLTTDGGTDGLNNNQYNTNYHYTNSSGAAAAGAGVVNTGENLSTSGWHTFGMQWISGSSVAFYLDGTEVSSYTGSSVAQMVSMYMILDYAVGGWPGTPSTTQWPVGFTDKTQVDWVRAWQINSANDAPTTWNVNGGGSFATTSNWTAGVPQYGNQVAIFGSAATPAPTAQINLAPWQLFGGVTFNGGAGGTTAYTIGSASTAIQLASTTGSVAVTAAASSTASQTLNANVELWSNTTFANNMTGGQTLNVNGSLSGSGVLTASGVGTTVLSGSNTYTGGTVIGNSGGPAVLRVTNGAALGTGSVTFDTQGNGSTARLELAGGIAVPNNITFTGRNSGTVGIESVGGANTLDGTVTTAIGGGGYLIQSDAPGTLTLTGGATGATIAGVALQAGSGARTFTLQGTGNGSVTGIIQNGGGTVSIAKAGTGTWTLDGANTYTGTTTVTGGRLILDDSAASPTSAITVATGATLSTQGGLVTSGQLQSSGTIDLLDSALANLWAGTLSLSGATLNMQLGTTASDRIVSTGAATVTGTNTVNLSAFPGQSITPGSAYTIVTAASGLAAANFTVGTKPASLNFTPLALSTPTPASLVVTATGNPTPTTAYWTGAGSAATGDAANNWGDGAAVNTSNWSTDAAGTIDSRQLPGSITNVIFNATNAPGTGTTSTTQLDSAYTIRGLTFNVTAPTVTSAVLNTNGNVLTTGAGGVTLAATSNASAAIGGAGSVQLSASQSWANQNNAVGLTVAAGITAANGPVTLTFNGTGTGGVNLTGVLADGTGTLATVFDQAGTTTLAAANTYTGTTTVTGGAVEITPTGSVAGNVTVTGGTLRLTDSPAAIAPAATVNVAAGGTLDVRSATPGTAAAANLGALTGGGTVTRSTAGTSTLTVGASGQSGGFSGSIQDGAGQIALVKAGGGTLTLAGTSSFTGGTTIAGSGGALLVTSTTALGVGPLTIGQGGTNDTGELQVAGNISLAGVTTINLDSRSASNANGSPHIENVSGNNTISANLNIDSTGGSAANILSTSGTLTLAGNLSSTGLTSARGFDFYGAGNGVVSGVIADGTAQPTFVQKDGTGTWTLAGKNAYTGSTTVNGGTLAITTTNTLSGGVQIGNGGTLVLSGAETLKPTANALILHDGGTLQLQANAGNTTTSTSTGVSTSNVLNGIANNGSDNAFKFTDTDGGQATLQLRGDQNVTFNDTSFQNGVGNTTLNYDVNNLNNDGAQGVTLSVGSILSYNTAVNVSGNPTYTLGFGGVTNALGAATSITVNSANLLTGPIGAGGAGSTLALNASGGNITATGAIVMSKQITVAAAAGYKVALNGAIPDGGHGTSVSMSGAGTLVLNGADTYAGGTTVTGGVLAGTGSVTSLVTLAGGTITAGSGATTTDSIGTMTTTGGQNWSSGSFVAKVASTTAGAGTGNDLLVMTGLTLPKPSSFAVSLLATNGSSPAFTASNATLTSTPVAGSYIVLASDSEGSASPFNSPAVVASLNLTVSGVATKSAGDSIKLDGYYDGSNYDLIAEDVAVAAPEPTSLLLLATTVAPLTLGRRRRNSGNHR